MDLKVVILAWVIGSGFVAIIGAVAQGGVGFMVWGGAALVVSPPLALLGLVVIVLTEQLDLLREVRDLFGRVGGRT